MTWSINILPSSEHQQAYRIQIPSFSSAASSWCPVSKNAFLHLTEQSNTFTAVTHNVFMTSQGMQTHVSI